MLTLPVRIHLASFVAVNPIFTVRFIKVLHELQRLQAVRLGHRVAVPIAI